MNNADIVRPDCRRALDAIEMGGSDAHLESCPDCARELEVRKQMRERVKSAVRSVEPPPFLETKIRASIRESAARQRGPAWIRALAGAGVTLAAAAALLVAYQLGHLRWTTASQDSYIAAIANRVPTLMRVGLKDHVHCAYYRKYPKNPPQMEQFVADMGPQYQGLIPIVREKVPSEFRLEQAHQCSYKKRKYVHMVLKSGSRLMSLVLAKKGDGESFRTEDLRPALAESGIPMYRSGVQHFQIGAFETRDYLVYVISDLSEQQNSEMMLALAPAVKAFLGKLEG